MVQIYPIIEIFDFKKALVAPAPPLSSCGLNLYFSHHIRTQKPHGEDPFYLSTALLE